MCPVVADQRAMTGQRTVSLSSDFVSLALANPLLRALSDEGYTLPTPIQAKTIPVLLEGRDVLGCAQTGTGKTAAFALPLLHRLMQAPAPKSGAGQAPRVLVLAPTRELATQIVESFATYGRYTLLKSIAIFGGVSQFHQVKALQRGVDILVATPGRLIDLMQQRLVRLDGVQALVLDEADRMLDMGFIEPIRKIVATLPKQRHTLLFSATMPKEIMHLADALLRDPVKVAVTPVASAAPKIEQSLYRVDRAWKQMLLEHILDEEKATRTVVFTKTKHGADRVAKKLNQHGFSADAIHGNKAQNRRTRTLDRFKSGSLKVLVATDVAARGLDVDGVSHVINFDLPMEPEAYVHRIGRTGRAGASGIAIAFCDREEVDLLRQIERLTKSKLPERQMPSLAARIAARPVETNAHDDHDDERDERREHAGRPQRAQGGQARSAHPNHAGHQAPRQQQQSRGGQRSRGESSSGRSRGTEQRSAPAASSAPSAAPRAHHPAAPRQPIGIARRGQSAGRSR
jgi:ATP-dependent RNA helicase RhlE